MRAKTKFRTRLEALPKGTAVRVSGVESCKHPDYRKMASAAANIRTATGQRFRLILGARALVVTRTK
jgi:hypothetical protein